MARYIVTFTGAVCMTLLLCFMPFERRNKDSLATITMQEPIAVSISDTPEKKKKIIPKEKEPPKPTRLLQAKAITVRKPQIALSIPPLELDFSFPPTDDLKTPTSFSKGYEPGNAVTGLSADMVFNAAEVDVPPRIKKYFPPTYPPKAKGQRIEGIVMVRAVVLTNGIPQQMRVISAEPEGYFEQDALAAVRRWTFYPAKQDGKKVKVMVDIPIRFDLNT